MKCSKIVIAISLAGPFLALFGSVLFNGQSFGFRDSAYYYYPLFEWTAAEWGEGRVPLWNPLDNCGTPVVADSTSSVFYPGKLLFALPIAFYWRFKLYVLSHVGLAGLAAFFVARRWRASPCAAAICAMSYAFGGYVLFQHCNVVFLVSAAWLPFAVLFADRMLVRRSFRSALLLGATLSLMVLGGDPQTAYHVGLVAALYAVLLWRRERKVAKPARRERIKAQRQLARALPRSRPALLALASATGGLLAAIQILPSMQWSRASQRAIYERPRNVYEASAYLTRANVDDGAKPTEKWRNVRRGIFDRPQSGTHHDHIYQFSLGPWRLTELVWPNVSGEMYPVNRRWTNVIPGEDRIWTPSLYIGLLPLLLGLLSIRLRRGRVRQRWLSWCAILATVGSFGWYGIGWLLQEFQVGLLDADPNAASVGEPVGGLYWLMMVLLPGYAYFRFPAKLLVISSLALSLLAARGWDRVMSRPSKGLRRTLIVLALISAVGLVFLLTGTSIWYGWVSEAPGDDIWGPLDGDGALHDLRFTFATTFCVSVACLLLLHLRVKTGNKLAKWVPHLLLIITAADIAIANHWMVATVEDSTVTETSQVASHLSKAQASKPEAGKARIYRGSMDRWVPSSWRWNWSEDRIAENYEWQRFTVFPRHHLPPQLPLASAPGTITPADYATLIGVARSHGPKRPDGISEPHPHVLDALSVEYALLPSDFAYPQHQRLEDFASSPLPDDFAVWHNPARLPRCWIVRDIEVLPPVESKDPREITSRTREVLLFNNRVRDFQQQAVVECEYPPSGIEGLLASTNSESEMCHVISEVPGRVEIRVSLNSPALIVSNDYYYSGWTATVDSTDSNKTELVDIMRTNRVMRGVLLPEGDHRLVYQYRPSCFRIGAIVSGLAWLVVGITCTWFGVRGARCSMKTIRRWNQRR